MLHRYSQQCFYLLLFSHVCCSFPALALSVPINQGLSQSLCQPSGLCLALYLFVCLPFAASLLGPPPLPLHTAPPPPPCPLPWVCLSLFPCLAVSVLFNKSDITYVIATGVNHTPLCVQRTAYAHCPLTIPMASLSLSLSRDISSVFLVYVTPIFTPFHPHAHAPLNSLNLRFSPANATFILLPLPLLSRHCRHCPPPLSPSTFHFCSPKGRKWTGVPWSILLYIPIWRTAREIGFCGTQRTAPVTYVHCAAWRKSTKSKWHQGSSDMEMHSVDSCNVLMV